MIAQIIFNNTIIPIGGEVTQNDINNIINNTNAINNSIIDINNRLNTMNSNFQAGCNTIVGALTAKGVTPANNKPPAGISAAINNIATISTYPTLNAAIYNFRGTNPGASYNMRYVKFVPVNDLKISGNYITYNDTANNINVNVNVYNNYAENLTILRPSQQSSLKIDTRNSIMIYTNKIPNNNHNIVYIISRANKIDLIIDKFNNYMPMFRLTNGTEFFSRINSIVRYNDVLLNSGSYYFDTLQENFFISNVFFDTYNIMNLFTKGNIYFNNCNFYLATGGPLINYESSYSGSANISITNCNFNNWTAGTNVGLVHITTGFNNGINISLAYSKFASCKSAVYSYQKIIYLTSGHGYKLNLKRTYFPNITNCDMELLFNSPSFNDVDLSDSYFNNATNIGLGTTGHYGTKTTNVNFTNMYIPNATNIVIWGNRSKTFSSQIIGLNTIYAPNLRHICIINTNLYGYDLNFLEKYNLNDGSRMFENTIINNINLNMQNTNIINAYCMFANSTAKIIDLSSWNFKNVSNTYQMFYQCYNLTTIYYNPQNFNMSASGNFGFNACNNLVGPGGAYSSS